METVLTAVSIISSVCAVIFGLLAFVRNRNIDRCSSAKSDATVLSDIGYIKSGIDDIKAEQREQRKFNAEFMDRLSKVEESVKQAHKRIDTSDAHLDKILSSQAE